MITDEFVRRARLHAGCCVGLDTDASYLPPYLRDSREPLSARLFEFNRAVIDATSGMCACYKLQSAYYEAAGLEGLTAYRDTLAYLRSKDLLAIADVKRGDIAATGSKYAGAHLAGEFAAHAATVNVYMGPDSIEPWLEELRALDRMIFCLVKTSNPGSSFLQDLDCGGEPVFLKVADMVARAGRDFMGEEGYSRVGAVVGLTQARDFPAVASRMPGTLFLIPGYGAQGGTGEDVASLFRSGIAGLVNSSRGIICAHMARGADRGFAEVCAQALASMREDIFRWL